MRSRLPSADCHRARARFVHAHRVLAAHSVVRSAYGLGHRSEAANVRRHFVYGGDAVHSPWFAASVSIRAAAPFEPTELQWWEDDASINRAARL
jgi:hypothetical protein